jgi:hypothetical protein
MGISDILLTFVVTPRTMGVQGWPPHVLTEAHVIEDKWVELNRYLRSLAYRSRITETRQEDIIQSTIEILFREEQVHPFDSPRSLWGRATNVFREQKNKFFAEALPLSGVGSVSYRFARQYLANNDGNPFGAYENQTSTTKVGRDILHLVAGGTGQTDPLALSLASSPAGPAPSDPQKIDLVRDALRSLNPDQLTVVNLHCGFTRGPMPLSEIALEQGWTNSKTKSLWSSAKRVLGATLASSLPQE